ncbi:hypothetical protein [Streptococcus saliviloxodontae]|uniref:Bacteriocin transport accessory protein n=1 Tax=Streptococcus saliviloxodontae TaxID=1349416 RepID=A0ABS2PJ41_9STRE|nr:hypothetical protein [Streptococcus saliviloxodontae]MBM7635450.1 putative bacteriocin transport accessory protein [Streptococcus saliviloxodontae]
MLLFKKIIAVIFLCLSLLLPYQTITVSATNSSSSDTTVQQEKHYTKLVEQSKLIEIDETKLQELEQGATPFVLYMGRPTCPYCRAFLPKLVKALKNSQTTVYYIDSQKHSGQTLQAFRDRYDLPYVPNLAVYQNQQQTKKLDSTSRATVAKLTSFLSHALD